MFGDHPAADIFCPFFVRGKIVIFKIQIAKAHLFIHADLINDVIHTALSVRGKHAGRGAERAAVGASSGGNNICRDAGCFQNRIIWKWCLIHIGQRDPLHDPGV